MSDGVHYGEVEGLVSVERGSCSRGASCVVEYTIARLRAQLMRDPFTYLIFPRGTEEKSKAIKGPAMSTPRDVAGMWLWNALPHSTRPALEISFK